LRDAQLPTCAGPHHPLSPTPLQSPKPDDWATYHEEELFLDLAALFDRFAGPRNVLVGHSFGTALVTRLAGSHARGRVHRLVLIGAAHCLSLPVTACHCLPLPVTACHRPSLGAAPRAHAASLCFCLPLYVRHCWPCPYLVCR
jgi:pimeloyl-ACP methyl ester carboxylesterase